MHKIYRDGTQPHWVADPPPHMDTKKAAEYRERLKKLRPDVDMQPSFMPLCTPEDDENI